MHLHNSKPKRENKKNNNIERKERKTTAQNVTSHEYRMAERNKTVKNIYDNY